MDASSRLGTANTADVGLLNWIVDALAIMDCVMKARMLSRWQKVCL